MDYLFRNSLIVSSLHLGQRRRLEWCHRGRFEPAVNVVLIWSWTDFSWQDEPLSEFSTLEVAAFHAMHFLHSIVIQPNLELKTRPKQLLGSLPLDIVLPAFFY